MGAILRSFTFDRNTLKANALLSAVEVERHIRLAEAGSPLSKNQSNIVGALRSYMGVIDRSKALTPVGSKFLNLFQINSEDAWRWLLTRSLWLYSVPNGTRADVNTAAKDANQSFSFFRLMLGVLTHLSALAGDERYFYYEEFCQIFDDDAMWSANPSDVFGRIIQNRSTGLSASTRILLGDLEPEYGVSRDNLNTVLNKAFQQTGLFTFAQSGSGITGIGLSEDLDPVLRGRVRHVLDHAAEWDGGDWESYLGLGHTDFPEQVSHRETDGITLPQTQESLDRLVDAATADFKGAGLYYDSALVTRFVASLIAKRFVILTGLSGSGKTKLAQAFATWITGKHAHQPRFVVGETISAERIDYIVTAADGLSVELESNGTKVALPYALIDEWIASIESDGLDRTTSARDIRERVTASSSYSSQLSSFESHLKAAAFATIEKMKDSTGVRHYEIVAVGPDWTSKESCFGYADALNSNKFVRTTPIVDLLARASATPEKPFFLVLDEMNLSHVERYFAEFLSAAESHELMNIHGGPDTIDGVPPSMPWPDNLFVIGTVNVDETTYMFSPKVLDRANTIEFRVSTDELNAYLQSGEGVALGTLASRGVMFSSAFIAAARSEIPKLSARERSELRLLFDILRSAGLEFGFRTAGEMMRFFQAHIQLQPASDLYKLLDAQLMQKVLPRLSGSRRRLEGPLCSLAIFAAHERQWDETTDELLNGAAIRSACETARNLSDPTLHPLSGTYAMQTVLLPLASEKIERMLRRIDEEGFTSFAES